MSESKPNEGASLEAKESSSSEKKFDGEKSELLAALDTEIRFQADSQKSQGWTRWAIWGALAGLIWVATELWPQPGLNFSRVAVLALLLFVLRRALEEGFGALLPSARIETNSISFRLFGDSIQPLRPEIAYSCLEHSIVIASLIAYRIHGQYVLWAYACLSLAMGFSYFLSALWLKGLPDFINLKELIKGVTILQIVVPLAAVWQLGEIIRDEIDPFSKQDVRLALVINAALFLVSKMVAASFDEHRLSKLTHLRQHIAFNRITLQAAIKRAEELLSGVSFDDFMSPLAEAVRGEIAKLNEAIGHVENDLNRIEVMLDASKPEPQSALRLLDKIGWPPTETKPNWESVNQAWRIFGMNLVVSVVYVPDVRKAAKVLVDSLRNDLDAATQASAVCNDRYVLLKSRAAEMIRQG